MTRRTLLVVIILLLYVCERKGEERYGKRKEEREYFLGKGEKDCSYTL
jgi:hypothetical protein